MGKEPLVLLTLEDGAKMPCRAYPDDAGWDLATLGDVDIAPGEVVRIPTGVRVACHSDLWFRIVARSSSLAKWRLHVFEGTIDTGWRGELLIVAMNLSMIPVLVPSGTRLAQVILQRRVDVRFVRADKLPEHPRGESGFGSSG